MREGKWGGLLRLKTEVVWCFVSSIPQGCMSGA